MPKRAAKPKVVIAKTVVLSETRIIRLTDDGIVIEDTSNGKNAAVSFEKLAKVVAAFDKIDEGVQKLEDSQQIEFWTHVGDNWFVSLKTDYKCVDIRKWYVNNVGETRPTRTGISLRLYEWQKFKEAVQQIRPDLFATQHQVTTQGLLMLTMVIILLLQLTSTFIS